MSKDSTKRDTSRIQTVENTLALLELLVFTGEEMTLGEIAKALSWSKSKTHRYITSLRDLHYVEQSNKTGRYRLGIRAFEIDAVLPCKWNICSIAIPEIKELNGRLDEIVHLATMLDGKVLYIEKLLSTNNISISSDVGAKHPVHCTSLGKVMLANKEKADILSIIEKHGLQKRTERTITEINILEKELEDIRRQGYAINDGELMENLRCVAAPIYDRNGNVDYSISVASEAGRLQGKRLDYVCNELLKTAESISYKMGYRKPTTP